MRSKGRDASLVQQARKVRLLVDEDQARLLDSQSRICNWLWNKLIDQVSERMCEVSTIGWYGYLTDERRKTLLGEVYSEIGLRNLVPGLKERYPFLRSVYSSPLKNVALRMARTIAAHRKSGGQHGWPGHKAWAREWMSLEYEEPTTGWGVSSFGWLDLRFGVDAQGQRLGLRLKLEAAPRHLARARTCRIVREGGGRYYAVFTFRVKGKSATAARTRSACVATGSDAGSVTVPRAVYLDPNHKNFAYGLTLQGEAFEIENPPQLKQAERSLDKLISRRDRLVKKSLWVDAVREDGSCSTHWRPSRRWFRMNQAVQRLQTEVREQIKHFQFSLANRLVRDHDVIGIGDYVPANADHGRGRRYNRAVRNRTRLGQFKGVLLWVAQRSGKRAVILEETGTTRTCHVCGHTVAGGIPPGIREWDCAHCGAHHLRDENACQNGMRRLAASCNLQLPCSGPVPVAARCDWRFHPQGWQEMPRKRQRQCELNAPVGFLAAQQPLTRPLRDDARASTPTKSPKRRFV